MRWMIFLFLAACGGGAGHGGPWPIPPPPPESCPLPVYSNLGVCNSADEAIIALDIYHQAWPTEHYDVLIDGGEFGELMAVGLPGDVLVEWEDGWVNWVYGVQIGNVNLSSPVSFTAVR